MSSEQTNAERPPMDPNTSEATKRQLELAVEQGNAYRKAVDYMVGEVAKGGDKGTPAVLGDGPAAHAYKELLDVLVDDALPPIDAGCSAVDALDKLFASD